MLIRNTPLDGRVSFTWKHQRNIGKRQRPLLQDYLEQILSHCVYRKPKPGRSGDEVRQGLHVN